MRVCVALIATLCLQLIYAGPAAADPGCQDNPGLIGRCYWVQGSYGFSADNGEGLWRDTDDRVLVVRAPPNSNISVPNKIIQALSKAQNEMGTLTVVLHGAYKVCPIPPEENKYDLTEFICIQTGRHLSPKLP